eukprot:SAG11_NODE_141_length_14934_cov_4.821503_15_plen_137_part_00
MFFEAQCGLLVHKDQLLRRHEQPLATEARDAAPFAIVDFEQISAVQALKLCRPNASSTAKARHSAPNAAASAFMAERKKTSKARAALDSEVPARFRRESGGSAGSDEASGGTQMRKEAPPREPKVRTSDMRRGGVR